MSRLALLLGAATALLSALAAASLWTRSALTTAYTQGEAAGRSALQEEVARATLRAQLEARSLVAAANAQVVALQAKHEKLQERAHALDRLVDHDRTARQPCLDHRLVRALGRIGQ